MKFLSALRGWVLALLAVGGLLAQSARDVPRLIEQLGSEDLAVRASAVEALRGIGPAAKDAIPALVDMTKRVQRTATTVTINNSLVRAAAASALGRMQRSTPVEL